MSEVKKSVDLEEVKLFLYEKVKASGWDNLKTFVLSAEFDKILGQLLKETQDGKRFTPLIKNVFRAFEQCKYRDLKVVMLGQDPYPQPGVADGMAFSCSLTNGYEQPSMRFMFDEIQRTVYKDDPYHRKLDLTHWANQGVLLINTAFTTTTGKVGSHYDLWKPFLIFLFDMLNSYNPGTVYVYLGKKAEAWSDMVSSRNYKIFVKHPASAAHNMQEQWDSKDMFNEVDKILFGLYGEKMKW